MKKSARYRSGRRAPGLVCALCVLASLVLQSLVSRAHARNEVLIIAVSAADEAAGRRVQELLDEPTILLVPQDDAPSGVAPHALLAENGAAYGLVLDATAARVQVLTASGAQHTRNFPADAQVTPYEAAFVATELLALARSEAAPSAEVKPEPLRAPPAVTVTRRLQVAGRAALELAGFYQRLTMVRPSLALDLRPLLRADAPHRLVFGATLGLPGRHERQREGVEVALVRWDTQARLGFSAELGHTRILAVAQARLARAGVAWSGAPDARQHGTSLGLGAALETELAVSSWFSLFTALGFDVMARHNLYRIGDLVAFQEERVAWTALLGAVVTSPARAPAAGRTARTGARAY